MASTTAGAPAQLEHTGAAIVEEYYPEYATVENTVTPLYSGSVYLGSVLILLSMCMLGLPITALGYYLDSSDVWQASLALTIVSVVANVLVFLLGLAICMWGFKKHKRMDGHH